MVVSSEENEQEVKVAVEEVRERRVRALEMKESCFAVKEAEEEEREKTGPVDSRG